MRIFIAALGSRGDFELFLFLGQELHRRGHRVVFGTSPFYAPYVRDSGLEFTPVGTGTQDDIRAVLRGMTAIPDRTLRVWEFIARWITPQTQMSLPHLQTQAEQADYVVQNLGKTFRRGGEAIPGATVVYDPPENLAYLREGLASQPRGKCLNLVALNRRLVDPQQQWDECFRFTGYWQAPRPTIHEPAAELVAFLKAGPPPVVITLGSMAAPEPELVAEDLADALQLAGQRGVIVGGWSGVAQPAGWCDGVLCVPEAPYEWLFPQAACILHHGGTGTIGAVLRAGKVSVVFPQIKCQETYSWVLGTKGLATGFFEITNIDPQQLAEAIRKAVSDEGFQQNARTWKAIVAQDPGLPRAADLVEEHWAACQSC